MDKDTMSLMSEYEDANAEPGVKADCAGGADDKRKPSAHGVSTPTDGAEPDPVPDGGQDSAPEESDAPPTQGPDEDGASGEGEAPTEEDEEPTEKDVKTEEPTEKDEKKKKSALRKKRPDEERPDFSELLAALSDTRSRMDKLSDALAAAPQADAYEKALNILRASVAQNQRNEERLYKDLEAARKDERFTTIRPFLEFLITLHTEMLKSRREYQGDWEEFERQKNEELLKEILEFHDYFINMIQHQLNFQGVEIISYEQDTPFSPVEQAMVRTAPTSDPGKNSMIASAETFGYRYDGKVLRPARVVVYKFSPAAGK